MSWLTLFNGVVAPLSNQPSYEQIQTLKEKLNALAKKTDLSIEVRDDGGLMVYRKARSITSTLYSPATPMSSSRPGWERVPSTTSAKCTL